MLLRIVFSSKDDNITDVSQVKVERVFSQDDITNAEELVEELKNKGVFSFFVDTKISIGFNNEAI